MKVGDGNRGGQIECRRNKGDAEAEMGVDRRGWFTIFGLWTGKFGLVIFWGQETGARSVIGHKFKKVIGHKLDSWREQDFLGGNMTCHRRYGPQFDSTASTLFFYVLVYRFIDRTAST